MLTQYWGTVWWPVRSMLSCAGCHKLRPVMPNHTPKNSEPNSVTEPAFGTHLDKNLAQEQVAKIKPYAAYLQA